MEKAREVRKDSDGRRNSTEQEHTERQKSKGNPGWQERVLRMWQFAISLSANYRLSILDNQLQTVNDNYCGDNTILQSWFITKKLW